MPSSSAGREPGNLKLIVLTHGDFDDTGNIAYLRQRFDTQVAMHPDDSRMAERGDLLCGDLLENSKEPATTP